MIILPFKFGPAAGGWESALATETERRRATPKACAIFDRRTKAIFGMQANISDRRDACTFPFYECNLAPSRMEAFEP